MENETKPTEPPVTAEQMRVILEALGYECSARARQDWLTEYYSNEPWFLIACMELWESDAAQAACMVESNNQTRMIQVWTDSSNGQKFTGPLAHRILLATYAVAAEIAREEQKQND